MTRMRSWEKVKFAFNTWEALPRTWIEVRETTRLLVALRRAGWHRTLSSSFEAVPREPVPRLSYGAINFLSAVLSPEVRVLEFGSGDSTIWFSGRAGSVTAIEHDAHWAKRLPPLSNVRVLITSCAGSWYDDDSSEAYSRAADAEGLFDLVVVDGMARTACAARAPSLLRPNGLVVLDDIDDHFVVPAQRFLESAGLDVIEFWGLRPGTGKWGGTAIYGYDLGSRMLAAKEHAD